MITRNSKTTPTEMEKVEFENFVNHRIGEMRFNLGAKNTKAIIYLFTEKFKTGEKLDSLASKCQENMQVWFPSYTPLAGWRFLNDLEIELDEKSDIEKRIPKSIFDGGHPIDNFYKALVKEVFPEMEV